MLDIKWLDGKDAVGQWVLEIQFASGSSGFIKNHSRDKIAHWCDILKNASEIEGFIIHSPQGGFETLSKVAA